MQPVLLAFLAAALSLGAAYAMTRRTEGRESARAAAAQQALLAHLPCEDCVQTPEFNEYKEAVAGRFAAMEARLKEVHTDNRDDHRQMFDKLNEIAVAVAAGGQKKEGGS